jgi:tRNA A37 threonylcarbamoyladenosine modification protein TsaB
VILALSACSAHGLWILIDPVTKKILSHASWTDDDSTGLSEALAQNFRRVLLAGKARKEDLTRLLVVTGPGAFTGLRMSASFMQGLARALQLPLQGISTYELVGKPFYIPTRHQVAKTLSLDENLARGLEFLRLDSSESFALASPPSDATVRGTKESAHWPDAHELLQASLAAGERELRPLKLIYGLEPKISGQR